MTAVILCAYLLAVGFAVARATQQPHEGGDAHESTAYAGVQVFGLPSPTGEVTGRGAGNAPEGPRRIMPLAGQPISVTVSNTGWYRGRSASFWYRKYVWMRHVAYQRHLKARRARRALLASPSVTEAIELAAATYGNRSLLWNIAACETGGTFSPTADNPTSDATGLFQFMPGTFRSTPYGGLSIWSPYASAMAAGWMFTHGRRGEWVC